MTDLFMYADETGNLDYQDQADSSTYFGIGTALFTGNHGTALRQGPSRSPCRALPLGLGDQWGTASSGLRTVGRPATA